MIKRTDKELELIKKRKKERVNKYQIKEYLVRRYQRPEIVEKILKEFDFDKDFVYMKPYRMKI